MIRPKVMPVVHHARPVYGTTNPMPYDPDKHHRRSVRWRGYDYGHAGAYFVTICVRDKACVLGEVAGEIVRLTSAGEVAQRCWHALPEHFPHVETGAFVVMPNHVHGVLVITEGLDDVDKAPHADPHRRGTIYRAPTTDEPAPEKRQFGKPVKGSLSTIIRTYKAAVTRQVRQQGALPDFAWQRGFHDRVVRNGRGLRAIRRYVAENPLKWHLDREHPNCQR